MEVPINLKNRLNTFKTKISSLKNDCQNLLTKYDSIRETIEGNALEEATLDLTTAFTINSLFWLYLTCKGLDPKNHDLRLEINRIKQANLRLKKLQETSKAPKINIPAAKRFIRGALFDPENDKSVKDEKINDGENEGDQARKRKRFSDLEEDAEMKPEVQDKKKEKGDGSKDGEDDENDDDDEPEVIEDDDKTGTQTNSNDQNNSRDRESRKRHNERPNKGFAKKRMFKKQMKKKSQRKPNKK